jgi:hypothetical protein
VKGRWGEKVSGRIITANRSGLLMSAKVKENVILEESCSKPALRLTTKKILTG